MMPDSIDMITGQGGENQNFFSITSLVCVSIDAWTTLYFWWSSRVPDGKAWAGKICRYVQQIDSFSTHYYFLPYLVKVS